jgi:hypothetical protein
MSDNPIYRYPDGGAMQIARLQVGILEWLYTGGGSFLPPNIIADASSIQVDATVPGWKTIYNVPYINQSNITVNFTILVGKTNTPYGATNAIDGSFSCNMVDGVSTLIGLPMYNQTFTNAPIALQIVDNFPIQTFSIQLNFPSGLFISTIKITTTKILFQKYIT